MCRGVSPCEGKHQVCVSDLRCPPWTYEGVLQIVAILNISSSLPCHWSSLLYKHTKNTPALSHDKVLKKGLNKHSMNFGPSDQYDTEMWWQNLRRWGKSDL